MITVNIFKGNRGGGGEGADSYNKRCPVFREMEGRTCETPGCEQPAKLQCPTCIKLNIQGSFFCSQECFKNNWDLHKNLHKLAKGDTASQSSKKGAGLFNPWPGYNFTGKLRPASQSDTRVVPDHIPRPDYANHPEGYPMSEMKLKGNTYIRLSLIHI